MPDDEEITRAIARVAPRAEAVGLHLASDPDWRAVAAARQPLASRLDGNHCWLRHTAWLPGADWSWLFPPLPGPERSAWVEAAVLHELTHCVERQRQAARSPGEPRLLADSREEAATPPPAFSATDEPRRAETLADLAFAHHLSEVLPREAAHRLIRHLAAERHRRAQADPVHDTSKALDCVLRRIAPTATATGQHSAVDAAEPGQAAHATDMFWGRWIGPGAACVSIRTAEKP